MYLLNFSLSDFFSEPTYISIITGAAIALWITLRSKNKRRQTALLDAASNKNLEQFKLELSKKKVAINQINLNRHTPLILATAKFGTKYLIEELLAKGALINWQDLEGNTALHYAVDRNNKTLVKVFLDQKADLTLVNKEGFTAIVLAKELDKTELVELFSALSE
ncbi:MAG: ankyrin repeat domain-containing protein [Prolixibacteraceae bacterium]|jgi:ankyrin repeat protein|nr:ankyrin repeat domain-containing protein [Prolixibacteraceae bacterium]